VKAKPVVPREQAHQDVEDAIAHHLAEDAEPAALGFIAALERAYSHFGSSGFRVGGMSWRIAGTPAQSRRYAPPSLRYGLR
jgi:hypothetical protein